jgi:Mg2+ and Co2+ transporter CorA
MEAVRGHLLLTNCLEDEIPGMTAETERYVRDLYDHLIRISDMVDSYRDLLSGSLEAYVSMGRRS